MAKKMKVEIIALDRLLFSGDAEKITVTTTAGEITILPEHMPLAAILQDAPLKLTISKDEQRVLALHGGYLTINKNEVLIVADAAIFAADIDRTREEEAIRRNEKIIADRSSKTLDVARAQIQLQRSLMNLRISEQYKK